MKNSSEKLLQQTRLEDGRVLHVELARPKKRNALSDALIMQLHDLMVGLNEEVRVVVLSGMGEHFCAGLDLSELKEQDAAAGVMHSRRWHAAFEEVQFGRVPVIAALHGAVVGGGLELAAACHIRVAAEGSFFALPEGQRGLFLGGGGSVRISRLIGFSRVTDMMLTGRVLNVEEALGIGLIHYGTNQIGALAKAFELAQSIAGNAPLSNFAVMHALPRITEQSQTEGLFTESLMAAVAQSAPDAKARMEAFLSGRAKKVSRS
jgi:enoyl-CoA hydratase/carnithine racemase